MAFNKVHVEPMVVSDVEDSGNGVDTIKDYADEKRAGGDGAGDHASTIDADRRGKPAGLLEKMELARDPASLAGRNSWHVHGGTVFWLGR